MASKWLRQKDRGSNPGDIGTRKSRIRISFTTLLAARSIGVSVLRTTSRPDQTRKLHVNRSKPWITTQQMLVCVFWVCGELRPPLSLSLEAGSSMLLDSYLFMAVSSKTTTRTLCFWLLSVYIVIFVDKFVLVSDEFRRGNPTTKIVHVDCPILQQPSSYANYIPLLLPDQTRDITAAAAAAFACSGGCC